MEIKLRRFALSDLKEVQAIDEVSFPNRKPYSRTYLEKLFQKYPEGFILAKIEGEIVGYTMGQPKNGSVEIISLVVKPAWRQKGIGRILTDFLINYFQVRNFKEIFLYVRTGNKRAISFYQGLGFKVSKTIKNYYKNGDDACLMRKDLGN